MLYEYLKRGVAAGVVAGLVYGLYVAVVANPLLAYAHERGEGHGHGHDHAGEAGHPVAEAAPVVSETTNAVVSVGTAVLWGILLASVFAIVYYVFEPALPGRGATKAVVLAAAGFFSVSLTPWLVLPPAAPGGDATIGIDARMALYVGLVVLGAAVAATSVAGYRRTASAGRFRALAVAAVPVALTVAVLPAASPTIITYGDLPAELVLVVQGSAFLSQAGLWAVVAGAFVWIRGRAGPVHTPRSAGVDDDLAAGS